MVDILWIAADQNNFGDTRGGALAGPLALFIIALLSLATIFLIRSMSKHLRKLPSEFSDSTQSEKHSPSPSQ